MDNYKLLLDFFGQVDEGVPNHPLFELGKYSIEKITAPDLWYIKINRVIPVDNIIFESQGEALNWVVKNWAKDQSWKMTAVTEYRHKGNYIISYNDKSGDWDFYNGTTRLDFWSDPISAFDLANKFLMCIDKRKSISKRIKKVKQSIMSGKLHISVSSIKDALTTVANIEINFNQRTGGLTKIEIVTLNSLYKLFGGVND